MFSIESRCESEISSIKMKVIDCNEARPNSSGAFFGVGRYSAEMAGVAFSYE